jgi:hypothetical protein
MWCGMIAVSIAGLFSAAWMVRAAAAKLRPASQSDAGAPLQYSQYATDLPVRM